MHGTIIFSIIIFIITIFILKDTYFKDYYTDWNYNTKLERDDRKVNITILYVLLLLIMTCIPIFNLIGYTVFYIIFCMGCCSPNKYPVDNKFSVLYIKGNNFITKSLKSIGKAFKSIWKLLNTPI